MAARKKVEQTSILDEEEDELEPGEDGAAEGERQRRTQAIEVKGLPEGVRAVLRLKPWRDVKEWSAYIYRREPDPTRPGRVVKKFQRRVFNTEIEESWLQAQFPRGGKFSVIYQVPHPSKPGDVQIHTDDFDIDPLDTAGASLAPGAVPAAPPVPQGAGGDLFSGIANLRALAEVVQMLQGNQPAAPAGAPAWLEKMYQDKIRRLDEMEEKLQRKLAAPAVTVHEVEDEAAGWPEFLRPFVPTIKQYGIKTIEALAGKLMGGGFEGAGLRFLVLNSPTFQAIWQDPTKREAAAAALISSLGDLGENLVRLLAEEMSKRGQP